MTLVLRETLRSGFARAFTRNGLVLIVTFLVVSLLQIGLIWLVSTTYLPLESSTPVISTPRVGPTPGTAPSITVANVAMILGYIIGGIISVPIQVVAIRTMVSKYTARIPDEFVFHNMGWASLHTLLGSWLISILIGVLSIGGLLLGGFILFVVIDRPTQIWLISHWVGWIGIGLLVLTLFLFPKILIQLNLLFVCYEISTKDVNLIEAITGSWRTCRGNRFRLLALILITTFLWFGILLLLGLGIPFVTELDATVAQFITITGLIIVQVVRLAIIARAYVAVNDDSSTIIADETQLSG